MRNRRLPPDEARAEANGDLAMAIPPHLATRYPTRQSTKQFCIFSTVAFVVLLLNLAQLSYYHLPPYHKLAARYFLVPAPEPPAILYDNRTRTFSKKSQASRSRGLKTWPSLPSLLPWLPSSPDLPPHSCEGYFGNGFTQRLDVFGPGSRNAALQKAQPGRIKRFADLFGISASEERPEVELSGVSGERSRKEGMTELKSANSRRDLAQTDAEAIGQRLAGSLHCLYSETLRTSICEGRNMVMHPDKISMSAGGEPIESVIGRTDVEELPSFSEGAFEIMMQANAQSAARDWTINSRFLDLVLPEGQINDHKMRSLFKNIRTTSSDQVICSEEFVDPTLIVIRYEYANLFHTATDWYSAYVTSRVLDLPHRPNAIFVDGHCQSPMDDGWEALFSNVRRAKNFTGPVCFDRIIFAPLGYETALFKGLNSGIACKGCSSNELLEKKDNSKTARLREFGEMFGAGFNVLNRIRKNDHKILLVRREDYLAHPRHAGKPEARLLNEQELFDSMVAWAQNQSQGNHHGGKTQGGTIQIVNGQLAHMKMKEQVQAVKDASIIVGVHGAGLTHILFAQPGTVILELLSPLFPRPHYKHISRWMGFQYHSITMESRTANCKRVLEFLSQIMHGFSSS